MVIPLHGKDDWAATMAGLPEFDPGSAPIVFLAPHPDDETLAAGGLLYAQRAKRAPVTLVAVTDGENAYADIYDLGNIRAREQTAAAARLGIEDQDILRLRIADSSVSPKQHLLVEMLLPHTMLETHIIAPWPRDFHPDHGACGAAARELSRRTGARLTFYFFWTWHRGTPELLRGQKLCAFPLNPDQQAAKTEALAFHASQLHHPSGDPVLHDMHLWPAYLPFEVYLPA